MRVSERQSLTTICDFKIIDNHFNVISNKFKTVNIYWVGQIEIVSL